MALNSNFRTLTADNIEGIVEEKNYLKSSFENGTITGWREMAVTVDASGFPNATPTIGTDASPNAASSLSLSATSTTPLSGSRSLLVTVPTSLSQGHGFISDEFTLDRMDLGKVLTVSFDYERISGTYNFSGTRGSQTWMVYIYDATLGAANWIQPAGFLGMNQSSNPGRVACTFQSSVTAGQKYRVAVIASQAAAGASSIEFDNFTCSRQIIPVGQIRNPAGTIIATGSLTPPAGYLYCNGSAISRTAYAELFAAIGTTYGSGDGSTTFNIPDLRGVFARGAGSQTIGSISYSATLGAKQNDAMQGHIHNSFSWRGNASANRPSAESSNFATQSSTGTSGPINDGTNGTPRTDAETRPANQAVAYHICFSAGDVQFSSDTDTRVVAFGAFAGSQNIPHQAAEGSEPIFTAWSTAYLDTHAAWAGGGQYRIPVSGQYLVNVKIPKLTSTTNNYALILKLFKNSVGLDMRFARYDTPAVNQAVVTLQGSGIFTLNAGDLIDIRIFQNSGVTLSFGTESANLSIQRLSGPSVVAASETVAASYSTSSTGPMASGSQATVLFGNRLFDSHGAYNTSTGVYTVPVSGKYQVNSVITTSGTSTVQAVLSSVVKNGVSLFEGQMPRLSAVGSEICSVITTIISVNAGDTIEIRAGVTSGAGNFQGNGNKNNFSIARVGN